MRIESVVVLYGVLTLTTLAGFAYLAALLKRRMKVFESRYLHGREGLQTRIRELAEELESIRGEIQALGRQPDRSAAIARTLGAPVRIRAIRMIKHGEDPPRIAAALDLPRASVEFLAKVNRLLDGVESTS